MIELSAARASGLVGSKPSGAALSGVDFTDFDLHADLVRRSAKLGNWNSTPIEPTSEVCWATM